MRELRVVVVYIEALEQRILGQTLQRVRLASPFLLRTTTPAIGAVEGKQVQQLRRLGKRIAIGVEGELWLVLHLMIAGRLHWRPQGLQLPAKRGLAAFRFHAGRFPRAESGSQTWRPPPRVEGGGGVR